MNTSTAILLSTLMFAVSSQICNQVGVCTNSTFLVPLPANNSSDCMEKCRNYNNCNFGSFTPDYNPNLCLLFKTCSGLETESCPNCQTSEISCSQCDVPGLCLGRIIYSETSEDKVACLSLCKSTDGCTWFSFHTTGDDETCILFADCPEIQANPQFISGQKECQYGDSGQYLIAGGYSNGDDDTMIEVVELVKTNSTPSFGQLPTYQYEAFGAMFGNAPLLCGGFDGFGYLDTCISYQYSEWSQSHSMNIRRYWEAGVQLNSTTFWILGGSDGLSSLDSTEFIIQGQTNGVPGPKLPYKMDRMCTIKVSENEIFVIGGYSGESRSEVWIYDPQDGFARTQGPSLTTRRSHHSCSTMKDGEKFLLVVAGGYNNATEKGYLDSVEIYDPTDNTWHSGPSLPYGLDSSAMAASPDGKGVILFGGWSDENDYENRILELRAGADSWNILDITIQNGRYGHVVIPLS